MIRDFGLELALRSREIKPTLEGRAWLVYDRGDCMGSILATELGDGLITIVSMVHGVIVYATQIETITRHEIDKAESKIMEMHCHGD